MKIASITPHWNGVDQITLDSEERIKSGMYVIRTVGEEWDRNHQIRTYLKELDDLRDELGSVTGEAWEVISQKIVAVRYSLNKLLEE